MKKKYRNEKKFIAMVRLYGDVFVNMYDLCVFSEISMFIYEYFDVRIKSRARP